MKDDGLALVQGEIGLVERESGKWRAPAIFSRACSSASRMSTRIAPRSSRRLASAGLILGSDMTNSVVQRRLLGLQ